MAGNARVYTRPPWLVRLHRREGARRFWETSNAQLTRAIGRIVWCEPEPFAPTLWWRVRCRWARFTRWFYQL